MSLDTFEQSLLSELRQHVATHGPARANSPRRRTLPIAVGALATAGAAAVVLSLGTSVVGTGPAYAVDSRPNGDVVVTVYDLTDADGLEHALAAKGIHAAVTYVPGFSQAAGQTRPPTSGAACDIALAKVHGGLRFTLGAAQLGNGSRLDIVTSGSSSTDVGSPVQVVWSGGAC